MTGQDSTGADTGGPDAGPGRPGGSRYLTVDRFDEGTIARITLDRTVDAMGFYSGLQSCFTIHQLNHAHWAEVHDDGFPAARTEDGVPRWQEAPPVGPALVDRVGGDGRRTG